MAQAENHKAYPLAAKLVKLSMDERAPRYIEQALRHLGGERTQPGGQPTGQDGYGQSHCRITFAPSKSKRNRISSSPSSVSTCRTREPSSHRNIKNPPPPAPINLPPRAPLLLANSYQWLIRSLLIDFDRFFLY